MATTSMATTVALDTSPNDDAIPDSSSLNTPTPSVQPQPTVNGGADSGSCSNPSPSTQPTDIPTNQSPSKKKKRGNQGKFSGPQLAFLQSRIDTYLALTTRKERSKWIVNTTH
ncbi:hypothetical protein F5880DRAFT_1616455, partial [Lentinula raphanica]